MPTADACRKHGLSQATFYKFKSQYKPRLENRGRMALSKASTLACVTRC